MDQHLPLKGTGLKAKPDPIQLAILQVSDGDPAHAAMLKSMMWQVYRSSGSPYGLSEDGCFRWWREELELVDG